MDKSAIQSVIENKLGATNMYLVDLSLNKVNKKIQVLIDGDTGVTINDCVDMSRHIRSEFEEELEDYNLEVSSPGVGQPFTMNRQYLKNVGRIIEVNTADDEVVEGEILAADETGSKLQLHLNKKGSRKKIITEEEIELHYSSIKSAKVVLSLK